jgi:hypothetical protein
MHNNFKKTLTFLLAFLFIQLCEIYIMGGYDHQTIHSKLMSITIGIVGGLALLGFFKEEQ